MKKQMKKMSVAEQQKLIKQAMFLTDALAIVEQQLAQRSANGVEVTNESLRDYEHKWDELRRMFEKIAGMK
jgi:soluble cytochrome b562